MLSQEPLVYDTLTVQEVATMQIGGTIQQGARLIQEARQGFTFTKQQLPSV
jgi:hypothetical protein